MLRKPVSQAEVGTQRRKVFKAHPRLLVTSCKFLILRSFLHHRSLRQVENCQPTRAKSRSKARGHGERTLIMKMMQPFRSWWEQFRVLKRIGVLVMVCSVFPLTFPFL